LKGPWTKVGFIPVVIDTGPTDFAPGGPLKPHGRRSLGLERLGDPLASGAFPSRPHVRLMSVEKPEAHTIYEAEALRGGWTVRQIWYSVL
jgi:hypothetical protein